MAMFASYGQLTAVMIAIGGSCNDPIAGQSSCHDVEGTVVNGTGPGNATRV